MLEESNARYKAAANSHSRFHSFNISNLVMVQLSKQQLPVGAYSKILAKKVGLFPIKQKLGNNSYVINLPPKLKISNIFNIKDLFEYFPPNDAPVLTDNFESSSFAVGED